MYRRSAVSFHTFTLNPTKPFKVWEGGKTNLPAFNTEIEVSKEKLMATYGQMFKIRRMEHLCDQSYKLKKIRGFCHLYVGQEAIATGMENVLTYDDAIVTGYRDHAWHVTRGGTPYEVFAEMFAKQSGASKGKGGSMHMYNVKNNFYGGNGIVGAQVPIGVGLAWKHSYTNGQDAPKACSVALYGDGAANQGQIFEVFNMAALYRIPCIFVCENNQFGMGTSKKRGSYQPDFYRRCEFIPGLYADGMDVLAVEETTRVAKEWCLGGNGPIIIEFDSYRYMGHSMSDPDSAYRNSKDIESVRSQRDCLSHCRNLLLSSELATEAEIKAMEKSIRKDVDEQHSKAFKSAPTNMEELVTDVYAPNSTHVPLKSTQGTVYLN